MFLDLRMKARSRLSQDKDERVDGTPRFRQGQGVGRRVTDSTVLRSVRTDAGL